MGSCEPARQRKRSEKTMTKHSVSLALLALVALPIALVRSPSGGGSSNIGGGAFSNIEVQAAILLPFRMSQ